MSRIDIVSQKVWACGSGEAPYAELKKDEDWEADNIGYIQDASDDAVARVLSADPNSTDGRSQWVWIRLANGAAVLACYPQGETYMATENDRTI